jgi:hypothetical protein
METLLTLTIGEYSAVEITLRLVVALIGMLAMLIALTASSVTPRHRFPLFLAAVALGGVTWFQISLWQSWSNAFELAGTSYCVTGQLIADGDRIIAWAIGVPMLLLSFCCAGISSTAKKRFNAGVYRSLTFIVLAGVSLLSVWLSLAVLIGWSITLWFPRGAKPILLMEARWSACSILVAMLLTGLGSKNLLPLGKGAADTLVYGEVIRSLADILTFVIPGVLLLLGILRLSNQETPSKS